MKSSLIAQYWKTTQATRSSSFSLTAFSLFVLCVAIWLKKQNLQELYVNKDLDSYALIFNGLWFRFQLAGVFLARLAGIVSQSKIGNGVALLAIGYTFYLLNAWFQWVQQAYPNRINLEDGGSLIIDYTAPSIWDQIFVISVMLIFVHELSKIIASVWNVRTGNIPKPV